MPSTSTSGISPGRGINFQPSFLTSSRICSMVMKFHPTLGPKQWIFRDPDTGHEFKGQTKDLLVRQILSYRKQNRLEEIEEIDLVLENYLCGLPENIGACVERKELKRGLFAYITGGVALFKNVFYKSFVSQEVADSRAEQCVKCPKNIFPDHNGFLIWSDELAKASVGDRRSKLHVNLGSCEVCSCPLRCKVFYDGKVNLTRKQKEEMEALPGGCWQLELNK